MNKASQGNPLEPQGAFYRVAVNPEKTGDAIHLLEPPPAVG